MLSIEYYINSLSFVFELLWENTWKPTHMEQLAEAGKWNIQLGINLDNIRAI